ncbi:MAG TPA: hypothetical protein PKD32_06440 [Saprospiraceae bacterium]|nr:hypothetical protein [Saprospiraceae bacterium]
MSASSIGYIMIAVVFLFNSTSCTKEVDKKLDPSQILEEMKLFEQKYQQKNIDLKIRTNDNGQEPNCFEATSNCNPAVSIVNYELDIPAYAPCKAIVNCTMQSCYATNGSGQYIFTINFFNFSAVPKPGPDCQNLINWWKQLAMSGNYGQLKSEREAFKNAAKDLIEKIKIQEYLQLFPQTFQCSQNNYVLTSKFYSGSCYKTCLSLNPFDMIDWYCSDACCKRTTGWCVEANGTIYQGPPNYFNIGTCDNPAAASCPAGYFEISSCSLNCQP